MSEKPVVWTTVVCFMLEIMITEDSYLNSSVAQSTVTNYTDPDY